MIKVTLEGTSTEIDYFLDEIIEIFCPDHIVLGASNRCSDNIINNNDKKCRDCFLEEKWLNIIVKENEGDKKYE